MKCVLKKPTCVTKLHPAELGNAAESLFFTVGKEVYCSLAAGRGTGTRGNSISLL